MKRSMNRSDLAEGFLGHGRSFDRAGLRSTFDTSLGYFHGGVRVRVKIIRVVK